ncbi:MAG TPA: hypothetical protein VGH87_27500 [Polyangiaceae bacterium]|jgi:hypothetical protein
MKWHVFAASALLFLVTLACRNRTPMRTYDAAPVPTSILEPSPVNEASENEAVTKKMKMIDTIAATKLPQMTRTSTLKPNGPKPKLNGFDFPATAAVVDSNSIPAFASDHQLMAFEADDLWSCSQLARGTKTSIDKSHRDACIGYRYLVVMRFVDRINPKMTGDSTYRGGHTLGDATVFDLDSGERLGAVPFSAVNAAELQAMKGVEIGRAKADLETQSAAVAKAAIDAAWP